MPPRAAALPFLFAAALAALAAAPAALPAQRLDARVASAVERLTPEITEIRHHIHQHPELGNREVETAKLVAEHLRGLGMQVRTNVAHTGVVGVLKGALPGPVVAVRADMDALPVTEDTPFPWRSTVRATYLGQEVGVAHACGHDVHTAVQLGVASVLASMKDRLPGTVVFIFQPAEEGPPPGEKGGAKLMLEEGAFDDPKPSAVFGLHAWADLEVGTIGVVPGPMLAAAEGFDATITGRQAHGALPHQSIDPIVMASEVVMMLQTIRSRTMNPMEPGVVTVGILRGGERRNIIPTEVMLQGTVRTFDMRTQEMVEGRMHEIFKGVAQAHGGSYTLSFDRAYPLTANDSAIFQRMRPTIARAVGEQKVLRIVPTTAGEDFSYFANRVPGLFFFLGSRKPGGTTGGHHTPTFQADDSAIPVGMRTMSMLLLDYLSAGG
ncbi:MAG TPA: amidohydrolase [Gemmatimonadaceae bacterium]|nr:amidohydrolase [Gemmatimonadaceae bacterium]